MTDTEKAVLYARIDELCAEVEKYRSARDASADLAAKTIDRIRDLEAEVEYARQTSRSRLERIDQLKDENAKLRTALSAVLQCNGVTKRDKGCDACPMYDKEKEYVWAGDWCGIKQFICELGIEVTP